MATTTTTFTTRAMRPSVRSTTASSSHNKWNDVNTHINTQLTMYNKYTNDDVHTDACVGAHHALSSHIARTLPHLMIISHLIGSSPEQTLCHPRSYPWCVLFDSTSPFLYFSFLSFSVYFLHNELFLEPDNPIVMASLRYSAAEKSEGTLNASHSFTLTFCSEPLTLLKFCSEPQSLLTSCSGPTTSHTSPTVSVAKDECTPTAFLQRDMTSPRGPASDIPQPSAGKKIEAVSIHYCCSGNDNDTVHSFCQLPALRALQATVGGRVVNTMSGFRVFVLVMSKGLFDNVCCEKRNFEQARHGTLYGRRSRRGPAWTPRFCEHICSPPTTE